MTVEPDHPVDPAPELRRLVELRDLDGGAWKLTPLNDSNGEPLIWGTRYWPDTTIDTFVMRDQDAVHAFRTNRAGAAVWHVHGALDDVVDAIIRLAAPDAHDAPRDLISPALDRGDPTH